MFLTDQSRVDNLFYNLFNSLKHNFTHVRLNRYYSSFNFKISLAP